jgi:hypothetical protein
MNPPTRFPGWIGGRDDVATANVDSPPSMVGKAPRAVNGIGRGHFVAV